MAAVRFTLSPEHCARVHDALSCLAKFSELVSLEARYGQLALSALNSSKSAYALIVLARDEFFWAYDFDPDAQLREDRFTCCILNKALASVFKGRLGDLKSGERGIEKCEAVFEDQTDGLECRLVMKLIYKQGITKTYKLTYESTEMMQAVFDKGRATSSWKASARMLRELMEFFGPKTEQLDICAEEEQVTLTSYTEKVMHEKETLKQPLQTAVTIETSDFDHFEVQDGMHVAISVKDYRTIMVHADTLKATVTALYSQPSQPLQFSYGGEGMRCEFTLTTIGDFRGATTPAISRAPTREPANHQSNGDTAPARPRRPVMAPPPNPQTAAPRHGQRLGSRVASQLGSAPSNAVDADPESLFVPAAQDDDRQWQPLEDRDDEGDLLGWDASADNDTGFYATFRDDTASGRARVQDHLTSDRSMAATQRASAVRGLFD